MKKLLFLLLLIPTFAYADLSTNLNHAYKFDSDCLDHVGTDDCTLYSATYDTYGLKFGSNSITTAGSGKFGKVSGLNTTNFSGSWTINVSMRRVTGSTAGSWIFEAYANSYSNYWIALYENMNGTIGFDLYDGPSNGNHNPGVVSSVINDTNRHDITIVRNKNTCTMLLYLDGSLSASNTDTTCGATIFYSTDQYFGSYHTGGNNFNGSLDEIYYWSRALDATEIATMITTNLPVGSGGGGGGGSSTSTVTNFKPAKYYDSIATVLSFSTTTLTAPKVNTALPQGGLVFIKHKGSPRTVTWNGDSMTRLDTSSSTFTSIDISTYFLSYPETGNIVISGATTSLYAVNASTYTYGDNIGPVVLYDQFSGSDQILEYAYAGIPTLLVGLNDYYGTSSPMLSTIVRESASGTILFDDVSCNYYDCTTGFISLERPRFSTMVGVLLYSSSTVNASSTETFDNISSDLKSGFQSCSAGVVNPFVYLGCLLSNFPSFAMSLFIPSQADMEYLSSYFLATVQQVSNPILGFFTFGFYLDTIADTTATSSASFLTMSVPTYYGGVFATTTYNFSLNNAYSIPEQLDKNIAGFLNPFIFALLVFITAYLTLKVIL